MAQISSTGDSRMIAASEAMKSNARFTPLLMFSQMSMSQKLKVWNRSSKVSCRLMMSMPWSVISSTGKLGRMKGGFSTTE